MNDIPEKMDGISLDISAENRVRLKALFPSVFTETVNDKGELVESVDFEKLKAELGTFTDLFEARRERYGMDWPGKKEALMLIQTPSAATLNPCREESVSFDTTENLFIEGDNLEVLKLLQKSYYGKVKVIEIDPPYNTGKEFIYPDNYSETLETYLEYAGLIDDKGKKFSTNTANEGRFHTKWLNMMYPRLYLARNLLKDDGVIFIHIERNEQDNLIKLGHEIFGEENFLGCLIWRKKEGGGMADDYFVTEHEYIVVYQKSSDFIWQDEVLNASESDFKNEDDGGKYTLVKLAKWGNTARRADRPSMYFSIVDPDGNENYPIAPDGSEGRWRLGKNSIKSLLAENLVEFKKRDEKWVPYEKIYFDSEKTKDKKLRSILYNIGGTASGTNELTLLFGKKDVFDNPKPTSLLQSYIKWNANFDSIVLDFFSGSSTTAHAVLDQNKKDGGNRKFIMVQLPEPCAEDSEAFKTGYKTIADIGKERIRRVIKKLNEEQEGKLDLGSADVQDRGFKVLKLDKSNFKQWQKLAPDAKPEQIEKQLFDHIDHIEHKATPEDLLFEILIKAGFMPTEKVQTITLAGIPIFSIADGGLLVCLADNVTKELINAVAEAEPMQFICLDKAFGGNDQLKANAVQTFNARNMGRENANQIVFRTV